MTTERTKDLVRRSDEEAVNIRGGLTMVALRALLPAVVALLGCRGTADHRPAVEPLEERLRAAIVAEDTATLADLLAPEYLSTSAVGHTSTRDESLLAYGAGMVRVDSAAIGNLDIRSYGRTAVSLGLMRWGGSAAGRPFAATVRFQHVWVRQDDGRWRLVASQLTTQPEGR